MRQEEGRKKKETKDGKAPLWMVTMGDMTILLMTFFIILFSLSVMKREQHRQVWDDPKRAALPESIPSQGLLDSEPDPVTTLDGLFPGSGAGEARRDEKMRVNGVETRIISTPEGTIVTVGGEPGAFREGSWKLRDAHRKILKAFLDSEGATKYRVLIRGFTAGNFEDSLVREEDGTVRPFQGHPKRHDQRFDQRKCLADDDWHRPNPRGRADHFLLASFRARSIRKFLVQGIDGVRIDPDRIRVHVEAYNEPRADNHDDKQRQLNRRVEIHILPPS